MRVVAAIAAVVGILALAGPAAAVPRAPFTVALGDTASISGTPIRCVASGTATESGILCSLAGKDGKEPAGSLGVALSSRGEAIVVKFEPKGNRAVWRVKAVRGASPSPTPSPSTPPPLDRTVHVTDVGGSWKVTGTDILCTVGRVGLQPGLTCSRVDTHGPRKNSNSIAMTPQRVGIYRFDGSRHAKMRVEEPQPARATTARRPAAHRAAASQHAVVAQRTRAAAAPSVIEIGIGDTLRIAGSRVTCAVTANGAKTGILCLLLATSVAPLPGSYAVGLAEDGEAILVGYDRRGQGALVTRFTQARARDAGASRTARIIGARLGGVYRVRGTDIVCAVATTARPAGVTCFMAGPGGRVIGSAGIAISDGVVARIFRVTSRTKVRSLVEKLQPAAR